MRIFGFIIPHLLLLPFVSSAQDVSGNFSPDLARYYFASPVAERAARADFDKALRGLERFKGPDSGSQLLSALQAYENVLELYYKHDGYLHLRCAQNRRDEDSACQAQNRLESDLDGASAFLRAQVLAIPEARLEAFFLQKPALQAYKFALHDIRRDAANSLSLSEEELLSHLSPEIADWQYELYNQVVAQIPFGTVQTAAGPLDVIRQRGLLAVNSDPKVREEAFKRRLTGFHSQRDLLAFALIHTVKAQDALARVHHYSDAPSRKYIDLHLKPEQTRHLLDWMSQHGDLSQVIAVMYGGLP